MENAPILAAYIDVFGENW